MLDEVRGEKELMLDIPAPNLAGDQDPGIFRGENRFSGDVTLFIGDLSFFTGETTVSTWK